MGSQITDEQTSIQSLCELPLCSSHADNIKASHSSLSHRKRERMNKGNHVLDCCLGQGAGVDIRREAVCDSGERASLGKIHDYDYMGVISTQVPCPLASPPPTLSLFLWYCYGNGHRWQGGS